MIKQNKWQLILSSVIILLPILAGILMWNDLPEIMATHWGFDGSADGFMARGIAVFALPLFLLTIFWLGILVTARDKKSADQNKKALRIVFWILPAVSLVSSGITYAVAFGNRLHMSAIMFLLLGVMFVVIGNYLPKCKQNFNLGIKVKWALANEENWNATHRFGGRVWVIGGLLLLPCALLPEKAIPWVLIPTMVFMTVPVVLYSYLYYKKQVAAGTAPEKAVVPIKNYRLISAIVFVLVAVILAGCALLCFTGDIELQYGDTAFTIKASYYEDLTVSYADIDSIEYRECGDPGVRAYGFGSPRLSMGTFENDVFGKYTRYSYTQCQAEIVLTVGGKILVINGKDAAETQAIFKVLSPRIQK